MAKGGHVPVLTVTAFHTKDAELLAAWSEDCLTLLVVPSVNCDDPVLKSLLSIDEVTDDGY